MNDCLYCAFRVRGHLPEHWRGWFEGLTLEVLPGEVTALSGTLPDQAAFYGALECVRNLGLVLVSIQCEAIDAGEEASVG